MKLETLKWILVAFAVILLWQPAFANTIGFSYSQAVDDTSWGVHGDYEAQVADTVKVGLEGQLQSGDVYLGNLDLALTFDLLLDVRLESNNTLKGYQLDTLGRTNDLGLSLVVPTGDIEWSVGVFGKNGSPFGEVWELADQTDPTSAKLVDAGLSIKEGSSLNVAIRGEFDLSRFEIGVRGLLEALGEGEKVHQLDFDVETGGQLTQSVGWAVQGKLTGQLYGGVVEYETALISSVQYSF